MAKKFCYDCQGCILLVRRIVLRKGRNSWKKWFFFTFSDWGRKINWMLLTFFLHCWQNCNFRRLSTILIFFRTVSFFIISGIWVWKIHTFRANVSAKLSQLQFRFTKEQLMRNWISLEKCNSLLFNYGPHSKKCVEQLMEMSIKAVRAAFSLWGESFWKQRKVLWATWFFFSLLWLRAEKNSTFDELFSALLTKNCVSRAQHQLDVFFELFSVFHQLRALRIKLSHSKQKMLGAAIENAL